jgi:Flp pilus assembly protein TadB
VTGWGTAAALLSVALATAAAATWSRPDARGRLGSASRWAGRSAPPAGPTGVPRSGSGRRFLAAGASALAFWLIFPGVLGPCGALVLLALVPYVTGRLEPAAVRREREALSADLPLAVELVAACLAAGTPPEAALSTVASALRGPLGARLGRVGAELRLGAEPSTAWRPLSKSDNPDLQWLARSIVRSIDGGAPLAATLDRAAAELRSRRRSASTAAARAVAVKAVVPLGVCFLPAFLALGVVPTVWGIAAQTVAGWR